MMKNDNTGQRERGVRNCICSHVEVYDTTYEIMDEIYEMFMG